MRGPIPVEFNRVSAPMLADGSGFKTVPDFALTFIH
jgi:hypothetical protein